MYIYNIYILQKEVVDNRKKNNYHRHIKLSQWAKKQGVTYRTAWEYFRTGKLPAAYRLPSGAIIVPDENKQKQEYIVTYARVSSPQNKSNLDKQSQRLIDFCNPKRMENTSEYKRNWVWIK